MIFVFLALVTFVIWVNLIGLSLLVRRLVGDYAVARISSILGLCVGLFFVEHYVGLGARPPLLPFSTLVSAWLIWRDWRVLRENWTVEALFGLGYFYCLTWRCAFPDIDLVAERLPDLMFIQSYMVGDRLPAIDRWLPPYSISFYYGLQHYAAGLLSRWVGLGSGHTYHVAYSVLVGLVVCAGGSAARQLCPRWGHGWLRGFPWLLATVAIMISGNGLIIALQALTNHIPLLWQSSRFYGLDMENNDWNALGKLVYPHISPLPSQLNLELPMDTFSYAIHFGEYHSPLAGFLILTFAALLIARLEIGENIAHRGIYHGLLAACFPLTLLSMIWVAPLYLILLGSWLVYRSLVGERGHWFAALIGGAAASMFAFPHLVEFTTQTVASGSSIKFLPWPDRTRFAQWLLMFWPVLGIMILAIWHRERRAFNFYLVILWSALLVFAEYFFSDDSFGYTWQRYNSTLKWWPWIYLGITVTLGASNLAARNRFCRWGTTALLLAMCLFGIHLGHHFIHLPKPSAFRMEGSHWLASPPHMTEMIRSLSSRPDGIAMESGQDMSNTEAGALATFANKSLVLGWPYHETYLWRGGMEVVDRRKEEIQRFYTNQMDDPLSWVLGRKVRYILYLHRDNPGNHFPELRKKLQSHYIWHQFYGNSEDWFIGYWERLEDVR